LISFTINTTIVNLYVILLLDRENRCGRERKGGAKETERERQTDRALRVRICGKTIEEKKKFPNFVVLGII